MFDVGFAEILLLSLIGLLVLGPERLPKVASTLGGMARKARSSWTNLKRSIEAEMRAEELKKPLDAFKKEYKATVDEVKSATSLKPTIDEVKSTVDEVKSSVDKAKSSTSVKSTIDEVKSSVDDLKSIDPDGKPDERQ